MENKSINKKNFVDKMVDFFRKPKFLKPLVDLYYNHREVWLYLFFGALTVLVNIVVYKLVNLVGVNYMISNIIAWILAVVFAYVTNKLYVFGSVTNTKSAFVKEISSFFAARLLSLGIDVVIMYVGVSILGMNDILVKVIDNVVVIIANYVMSKLFIFKNNNRGEKVED